MTVPPGEGRASGRASGRDADPLGKMPTLKDVAPGPQRQDLLLRKLKACERRCDFCNPRVDFDAKESKRKALVEIVDHVNTTKGVFTEELYGPLINMVAANLFRALPVGAAEDDFFDPEDDEPSLEPAWPHIQIVYELLRRFIVSNDTDPKLAKKYFDKNFVLGLLDLFDSEDPREREYLKNILHRIYGKIMPLRPFIRKSIMNIFHQYVWETQRHSGVAELLEILGSIINGFALPLKEEHKQFLRKSLMPLHNPRGLHSHHVQLSFCVTQFLEKDPSLATDILGSLLRSWPITHSRKEVMYLNEMEELLELTRAKEFEEILDPLFKQIAKCVASPQFQVAERALFFWNNEYIVNLVVANRKRVLPLVYGALRENTEGHWNANVLSLSFNVQKLLSEMDSPLYVKCEEAYERRAKIRAEEASERTRVWQSLEEAVSKRQRGVRVNFVKSDVKFLSPTAAVLAQRKPDRLSSCSEDESEFGTCGLDSDHSENESDCGEYGLNSDGSLYFS